MALLQLVANSNIQNLWLNENPDVTFFKKVYRRYTPFALESIKVPFVNSVDFGSSGDSVLLPNGDLLNKIYFVCDIPAIAAAFLNTRTFDIAKLITSTTLTDSHIRPFINQYTNLNNQVEFKEFLDELQILDTQYSNEIIIRTGILNDIQDVIISTIPTPSQIINSQSSYNPLRPTTKILNTPTNIDDLIKSYGYTLYDLKKSISTTIFNNRHDQYPVYALVRGIADAFNVVYSDITTIRESNVTNNILFAHVFYDSIVSREIMAMFFSNTTDSLTSITNNMIDNYTNYNRVNKTYLENSFNMPESTYKHKLTNTDYQNYLNDATVNNSIKHNLFGPEFTYELNIYNTINCIINSIKNTTPVVLCKAIKLNTPINIYSDVISHSLDSTYYASILDPNFLFDFNYKLNTPEQPIRDSSNTYIGYDNNTNNIYPNLIHNIYQKYTSTQTTINNNFDNLIEKYRSKLFSSTKNLFYFNSPPLNLIFDYVVPISGYIDSASLRIQNVFNINIWYFYFFSYLGNFNSHNFTYYLNAYLNLNATANEITFMNSIIDLVKINMEFKMKDASYQLNDLFAAGPSPNVSDTMKNYVPKTYSTTIDSINITTDLLAITYISHRSHIPTILEQFFFIFNYIETISIEDIESYLGIVVGNVPREKYIRSLLKAFYENIMKYFFDVYDKQNFESKINYVVNEVNNTENIVLAQYVNYFITGLQIYPPLNITYQQNVLSHVSSQMEFIFVMDYNSERCMEDFYHSLNLNESNGITSGFVTDTFSKYLHNFTSRTINTDNPTSYIQSSRSYNSTDNLYYSNFDNRYIGSVYNLTPYQSRDYGIVNTPILPPVPLPPTDPYGINPNYYNHKQCPSDYIIPPLINNLSLQSHINVNWLNTNKISVLKPVTEYKMYNIEYMRIRHAIFYNIPISKPNMFVDQYQFNVLRLVKLTSYLNKIYPEYDYDLIFSLWTTLQYLKFNINKITSYQTYKMIYNIGYNPTLYDAIIVYLNKIIPSMNSTYYTFESEVGIEFINAANELLNGITNVYTYDDLFNVNVYMNDISNITITDNIEQYINLHKSSFISQYFFYAKYYDSIYGIYSLQTKNTSYLYLNVKDIVYDIFSKTNYGDINIDLLSNISPLVYIYPESNVNIVSEIKNLINSMDDFSISLAEFIIRFIGSFDVYKLAIKDIYDLLVVSINSLYQIQDVNLVTFIGSIRQSMIDKISVIKNVSQYVNTMGPDYMSEPHILAISGIISLYDIPIEVIINYIMNNISDTFDNYTTLELYDTRNLYFRQRLNTDLDYMFLTYRLKFRNVEKNASFKTYTTSLYPDHEMLINGIDNLILYVIYDWSLLNSNSKYNAIAYYKSNMLTNEIPEITAQYNSLNTIPDISNYFVDWIMDNGLTITNRIPYQDNIFGESQRFSFVMNQMYQQTILEIKMKINDINNDIILASEEINQQNYNNIVQSLIQKYMNKKRIEKITNDILSAFDSGQNAMLYQEINPSIVSDNLGYDYYLSINDCYQRIVNYVKYIVQKGIDSTNIYIQEINNLSSYTMEILYRSDIARTAWVRKLMNFLVERVSFQMNDDVIDVNYSDWFEVFNEISLPVGQEKGYNRMIGNIPDLIIFNDKLKNKYTLTLPLIFYFNRNPLNSLPLSASINVRYNINIRLRKLSDVCYKDLFSDFINPTYYAQNNVQLEPFEPHIENAYLMCDYIYLTTEERYIYVSRLLEYIIEETQTDSGTELSDNNLLPIYQVLGELTPVTTIINGVKTTVNVINELDTRYIDKNQLAPIIDTITLIKRQDLFPVYTNDKMQMVYKPLNIKGNIVNDKYVNGSYIHKKRFEHTFEFHHPSKLYTMLIKPNIHTQQVYRKDNLSYFYGEKQWDNYGVFSYYDLSNIIATKKSYMNSLHTKLNDFYSDNTYSFLTILNNLIVYYDNNIPLADNSYDTWIKNNIDFFRTILHTTKDKFIANTSGYVSLKNTISLKENMLALGLNFDVVNLQMATIILSKVLISLGKSAVNESTVAFNLSLLTSDIVFIPKTILRLVLMNILIISITSVEFTVIMIDSKLDTVYNDYNCAIINYVVSQLSNIYELESFEYDFNNIMGYFAVNSYSNLIITNVINMIVTVLPVNINTGVKMLRLKEVIYELYDLYKFTTPVVAMENKMTDYVLTIIVSKMNMYLNLLMDNLKVDSIDYQPLLIERPKINPLMNGYLTFNTKNLMPVSSDDLYWSAVKSYECLERTPKVGINTFSWALRALMAQPSGTANLSRIDNFSGIFDIYPLISSEYPATLVTIILNINLIRYMSGLGGKAWHNVGYNK
jgi:hypothetical protein